MGISQAGRYVLVVNKDKIRRAATRQDRSLEGTLRVVDEGLAKDEWVVVNGIQRARPGAKVTLRESEISSTPQASEKAAPSSGK